MMMGDCVVVESLVLVVHDGSQFVYIVCIINCLFLYDNQGRECCLLQVEDLDFSSLLHCLVEVEDYNDHSPVFIPHFLSLAPLPEDISVGTSVAQLVASDSDSGQNRDITYSLLEESDPDGLFAIDQSGLLSVAQPLDRERVAQHHLVVIATDHGVPPLSGSATVQLPLLDVNDNGPEFEAAYSPVVFENVAGPQVGLTSFDTKLLLIAD